MARHSRHLYPVVAVGLLAVSVLAWLAYSGRQHFDVLRPAGTIASQQRSLLITASLLMLLIVLPVFILTFTIAWKYRASNSKASYQPDWDHHRGLEALWWGFPIAIIAVLAVLAWTSSHKLDPSATLASSQRPLTIQVVALQWKWLFIYPSEQMASVNYVRFPVDRPVRFEITADAPMNSLWIPRLGGQIYAMPGMTTQLNLQADQVGRFNGSSANLSGKEFSSMRFTAEVSNADEYTGWVKASRAGGKLDQATYDKLARPDTVSVRQYASVHPGLFHDVVMKYMGVQDAR